MWLINQSTTCWAESDRSNLVQVCCLFSLNINKPDTFHKKLIIYSDINRHAPYFRPPLSNAAVNPGYNLLLYHVITNKCAMWSDIQWLVKKGRVFTSLLFRLWHQEEWIKHFLQDFLHSTLLLHVVSYWHLYSAYAVILVCEIRNIWHMIPRFGYHFNIPETLCKTDKSISTCDTF